MHICGWIVFAMYYNACNDRIVFRVGSMWLCAAHSRLQVPDQYRQKMWLFAKFPGSSLVQQARKTLGVLVTRARCAAECLLETEFACLSATFLASHRNNRVR